MAGERRGRGWGADFDIADLVQLALEPECVQKARADLVERSIEVGAVTLVQQQ